MVDGLVFPDVVDLRQAGPDRRGFLEEVDEVVEVVLLLGPPGAHVDVVVNDELGELLLDELDVVLRQALVEPVDDRVGRWLHLLLWSHIIYK